MILPVLPQGPLPPSVLHGPTEANASQGEQPGERVKRKCGRPRNPIPRHKRDSHIMAEHRRRGKIQVIEWAGGGWGGIHLLYTVLLRP